MEYENVPPSTSRIKCCDCGCSCSTWNRSLSGTYLRSVKRKYGEFEEGEDRLMIPGFVVQQNARVEIGNECQMLRETMSSQQETIQELIIELDEEREASSSSANEAMSMILRLQREKAESQMELRQFKRFAEEKMAHDQQEMTAMEELLYKRDQTLQSLTCEVQAYKHRMLSYGLTEEEVEADKIMSRNTSMTENVEGQYELPPYEIYPPLRVNIYESLSYPDGDDENSDFEKYPYEETPRSRDQLKDLEYRINQLERTPRTIQPDVTKNVFEKVIDAQSPRRSGHLRKFSTESSSSPFAIVKEMAIDSPKRGNTFKKTEFAHIKMHSNLRKVDNASEMGDDMIDRVYTVDSVQHEASMNGMMDQKASIGIRGDDYMSTPRDSQQDSDSRDLEVQKLYARLHALEADRETMRQAIISVGTDKAQLVLLKEIAQNLCKDMSPVIEMPLQRQPVVRSFSFITFFKWIVAFVFWRRKARKCKYMFGLTSNNAGLLMLLDRGPRVGQWRCISNVSM